MTEESFLLVSLEEDKAKTLAQVLSNDTARKILDLLSKKDHSTETEISKELKMALSTVHYNLQQLAKSGLVNNEHFTYSEKGKEITHYSLSNKYVIIAPKKTDVLKQKLKEFLPVALVTAAASIGIKYFLQPVTEFASATKAAAPGMEQEMVMTAVDAGSRALPMVAQNPVSQSQEFALWFLFGSIFALVLYFVWAEIILKKKD